MATTKEDAVQWYAQNIGLYKKLSEKISNILVELLDEAGIAIHSINSRAKDIDSFKNKINDQKYDDPINQITDLSGIRIVVYVEDDLKPICKILEDTFIIDANNSFDKSDELGTDKVGYRSIHYIAMIKDERLELPEYKKFKNTKFEIQVRTILQHAWAEIEHDRNYKFNGVLPTDIQRRFKILAGTLELIDREFNQLSNEIDKISESVIVAEKQDGLDEIQINSTTLKQYLTLKLKPIIDLTNFALDFNNYDNEIIEELHLFGIMNLKNLDNMITPDIISNIKKLKNNNYTYNFLGILRDIMIISDHEKYFESSWKNRWHGFADHSIPLYELYDVNYNNISEKYGIDIPE